MSSSARLTLLVKEEHINDITRMVVLLNPKAKIVKTQHCNVNLVEVLQDEFWVTSAKLEEEPAAAADEDETGKKIPEACTARFDIASSRLSTERYERGNLFILAKCATSS